MPSFNLVDEGWIPCRFSEDGLTKDLSLREVFWRANEIREILDPSPLVTVALHRFLLAILHRNFGPASLREWQTIWEQGSWDQPTLATYLDKWRDRFDLFSDAFPFYQVPEIAGAEPRPVLRLAMAVSVGNNPTVFDHNSDDSPASVTAPEAARLLIGYQAFAIGFGKSSPFYFQDAPLVRGFTVLCMGDNLFGTLALNLIAYNQSSPLAHTGSDRPAWEQLEPPHPDAKGTVLAGYLDYLTWQSRRIHLIPEGDPPRIRYCQIQQNLKLAESAKEFFDPFKCYRTDPKLGNFALGLNPDRALWRDSHALFQRVEQSFARPQVFTWLARIDTLRRSGQIQAEPVYNFSVFGFATEPGRAASITLWRHERLPLPLAYLEDDALLAKLKDALTLAEDAARVVRQSAWTLAKFLLAPASDDERTRQPRKEDTQTLVDSFAPERFYWPHLEAHFRRLLVDLPDDSTATEDGVEYGGKELLAWATEVRHAASGAFHQTTNSLDTSARALKAVAQAERVFNQHLASLLAKYPEPTEEVNR